VARGREKLGGRRVREYEDVEQLGAGSGTEGVEPFAERAFQLVWPHVRRLRRRRIEKKHQRLETVG